MDPVSKLGRALAIIRRTATGRQPGGKGAAAGSSDASPSHPTTEAEFQAVVARRLRAVSPEAPGARNASVRILLEQVLLREFGQDVLHSPRFQDTVRDVQKVMEADAATRVELDNLIADLVKGAPGR